MKGFNGLASFILVALFAIFGCTHNSHCSSAIFHFDQTALSGVKPWTSKELNNNPDYFQFAVIGDQTGGADASGVFA